MIWNFLVYPKDFKISILDIMPKVNNDKTLNLRVEKISSFLGYSYMKITLTRLKYMDYCSFSYDPKTFEYSLKSTILQYGFTREDLDSIQPTLSKIFIDLPLLMEIDLVKFHIYELTPAIST